MAAEVRSIREVPRASDPKIVALVERLLVQAKAGEVTGFAYVLETPTTTDRASPPQPPRA